MLPTQLRSLGRSALVMLLLIEIGFAAVDEVRADEPEPLDVTVEPWDSMFGAFFAPTVLPGNTVHAVVRNAQGTPIANAHVVIEVSPAIERCDGAVLVGITNSQGEVDITALGGGCAHQIPLSAVMKVSGVTVRVYSDVKSPDFDGSAANRTVSVADLVAFANEFGGRTPSGCHDYNNNGSTGLEDLILFAPAFITGSACN
jgi:hypothetical protein